MPERRLAIELVFEDDFALLDFQEHHDLALIDVVAQYVAAHLGDKVRVETGAHGSDPYLSKNNLTKEWSRGGPPRPSEIAISRIMAKKNPDKTHWEVSRDRLERIEAERAERLRKDAEHLAALDPGDGDEDTCTCDLEATGGLHYCETDDSE